MALARTYGLRGADAIHVAGALIIDLDRRIDRLSPPIFVSADREQLSAATSEGLTVDDPNLHP